MYVSAFGQIEFVPPLLRNPIPVIARWITLPFVFLLMAYNNRSFGQAKVPLVTLDVNCVPVSTVFTAIERQTGYVFDYNPSMVDSMQPQIVKVLNAPLKDVLDSLFDDSDYGYRIGDRRVEVRRLWENTAPAIKEERAGKIKLFYGLVDLEGLSDRQLAMVLVTFLVALFGVHRLVRMLIRSKVASGIVRLLGSSWFISHKKKDPKNPPKKEGDKQ
jgi:hypothetical protein